MDFEDFKLEPRDIVVFEPNEVEGLVLGDMGERVIRCGVIVRDNLDYSFAFEASNNEGFEIGITLTDKEAVSVCMFILNQIHFGRTKQ